jgi:non-ribosomal peptide synthetase component F
MIYTSGTTGQPKGVMIHQRGMVNHLYAKINELGISATDTIAQTASAGFDISIWQFLAGLLVGGRVYIVDKETLLDQEEFLRGMQKERVTILETVPSLLAAFVTMVAARVNHKGDNALRYMRWIIPTGEALPVSLVRDWYNHYPGIKMVNAYGPTEAADDVTHYTAAEKPGPDQKSIPIGKPLQNLRVYILDEEMRLSPLRVRGEICVAGIGVGKGYWQDPAKTAAAFVGNPYAEPNREADRDYTVRWQYRLPGAKGLPGEGIGKPHRTGRNRKPPDST